MANFANQSKSSTSFSNQSISTGVADGTPLGLLLAITFGTGGGATSFSNQSRSSTSWALATKN